MMKTVGYGALCSGRAQAFSLAPLLCPRPSHHMLGAHKATAGKPQPLRALGLKAGSRSPWRGTPTLVLIPPLGPQASPARTPFFLCLPPPPGGVCSPGPVPGAAKEPLEGLGPSGGREAMHSDAPPQMTHPGQEKEAPGRAATSRPVGAPRLLFPDPGDGTPHPGRPPDHTAELSRALGPRPQPSGRSGQPHSLPQVPQHPQGSLAGYDLGPACVNSSSDILKGWRRPSGCQCQGETRWPWAHVPAPPRPPLPHHCRQLPLTFQH